MKAHLRVVWPCAVAQGGRVGALTPAIFEQMVGAWNDSPARGFSYPVFGDLELFGPVIERHAVKRRWCQEEMFVTRCAFGNAAAAKDSGKKKAGRDGSVGLPPWPRIQAAGHLAGVRRVAHPPWRRADASAGCRPAGWSAPSLRSTRRRRCLGSVKDPSSASATLTGARSLCLGSSIRR